MNQNKDIIALKEMIQKLGRAGKILIAILYGSYAKNQNHCRSDIDLAIYLNANDADEEILIIDKIMMCVEPQVSILRLNDDEESPFIIQEALKGIHLIEPDQETLYKVSDRVLHESEGIRFRRG